LLRHDDEPPSRRVDFGPRFFNVTQWYRLNLRCGFHCRPARSMSCCNREESNSRFGITPEPVSHVPIGSRARRQSAVAGLLCECFFEFLVRHSQRNDRISRELTQAYLGGFHSGLWRRLASRMLYFRFV
jgi:hypothetical protein